MKKVLNKIAILWVLIIAFFTPNNAKANSQKNVADRVNKIRSTIQKNIEKGDMLEMNGKEFYKDNVNEWINWGNWGNWNNWNNWAKWNNWSNWGNWGNWGNY